MKRTDSICHVYVSSDIVEDTCTANRVVPGSGWIEDYTHVFAIIPSWVAVVSGNGAVGCQFLDSIPERYSRKHQSPMAEDSLCQWAVPKIDMLRWICEIRRSLMEIPTVLQEQI